MNFNNLRHYTVITLLVFSFSCDPFEFSPFEVPDLEENETNLTSKNIEKISDISNPDAASFYFAIISDTHIEYSALEKAVKHINIDNDIRFINIYFEVGTVDVYMWDYIKTRTVDFTDIWNLESGDWNYYPNNKKKLTSYLV